MSDLYDRLEARHEERQRAAADLAGMLGLSAASEVGEPGGEPGADEAEKPRDEGGRFVVGTADAGEHGAAVVPRPSMGHHILALLDDDRSYLDRA